MGLKPCEFCGGPADTFGKYTSCHQCRDKALELLKKQQSKQRRRRSFANKSGFRWLNRTR